MRFLDDSPDIPPHVVADNCWRCGTLFPLHALVSVVGPAHVEGDVGLSVCGRCTGDPNDGHRHALDSTWFIARWLLSPHRRHEPPRYFGSAGVEGWARLLQLSDGTWRCELQDGHVRVFPLDFSASQDWANDQSHGHELGYTTDGTHTIAMRSALERLRVPCLGVTAMRLLDLRTPAPRPLGAQTLKPVRDPLGEDRWRDRQLHYYETPLTPTSMRPIVNVILNLCRTDQVWPLASWKYGSDEDLAVSRRSWREVMSRLELVLWQTDLWHAAVRGGDVFDGTCAREEVWPKVPQFWVFAQPYYYPENRGIPGYEGTFDLDLPCVLDGCFVIPEPVNDEGRTRPELTVVLVFMPLLGKIGHGSIEPPRLRVLPPIVGNIPLGWPYSDVSAAMHFMQLPIAAREVHRLPRQQRRALARDGNPVRDVQVIVLRRELAPHEAQDREGDIEWSCHWLVKGHWRRQWHPSVGEHRPIYIDAHLKGDFEKPFRPPRQKLYVVAR
jgi:hypothetical protein